MATKNIAISEEAYQRLKTLKKPGESFTDLIERITRTRGVLDLVGVLSESEAKEVSARIHESRGQTSRRLRSTVKELSVLDLASTGAKSASVEEMKKLLDEMRAEED